VWVYGHRRANQEQPWQLLSDEKHPDWRQMSVDTYIQHGRSELLKVATHAEILKVTSKLWDLHLKENNPLKSIT
jgi:hypothetical protein